jgi:thiamine biosynthesis protein ThiS
MSKGEITVIVNGETVVTPPGTPLLELLDRLQEPYPAAVIELNGRFVYKKNLSALRLSGGDVIEVILPSFGG